MAIAAVRIRGQREARASVWGPRHIERGADTGQVLGRYTVVFGDQHGPCPDLLLELVAKAVIPFGQVEFDRIRTLAFSGQLKYGYLVFTKPHYNTALVTSVSFSNESDDEPEDDDETPGDAIIPSRE